MYLNIVFDILNFQFVFASPQRKLHKRESFGACSLLLPCCVSYTDILMFEVERFTCVRQTFGLHEKFCW